MEPLNPPHKPLSAITDFENYLLDKVRTEGKKILETIKKEQSLSEELEDQINKFLEKTSKNFLEEKNA